MTLDGLYLDHTMTFCRSNLASDIFLCYLNLGKQRPYVAKIQRKKSTRDSKRGYKVSIFCFRPSYILGEQAYPQAHQETQGILQLGMSVIFDGIQALS